MRRRGQSVSRLDSLISKTFRSKDGKSTGIPISLPTESFLTVSGQLEGELLATALGDVYTFGPTFRAENSNTSRHAAEFWMIEPEMAWAELDDNMDVAEDFLKYLFRYALEKCTEEMDFSVNGSIKKFVRLWKRRRRQV